MEEIYLHDSMLDQSGHVIKFDSARPERPEATSW